MKMLKRFQSAWPTMGRDAAGLLGAGLVAYGVGEIYRPAGLIVAGVMLLTAVILSARASA